MTRADIYVARTTAAPNAILLLCPGRDGSGPESFSEAAWPEFASRHQLALLYLSFASDSEKIGDARPYYDVSGGSGEVLERGIREIFKRDLPLLVYGFSAGARFAESLAEWHPGRLIAWCGDASVIGEPGKHPEGPPGLLACGELDPRYGDVLTYFKKGRALGEPWLWVSLGHLEHERSPAFENFLRSYFEKTLSRESHGCWVDIDLKRKITADEAQKMPSLSGWLPGAALMQDWSEIHEP